MYHFCHFFLYFLHFFFTFSLFSSLFPSFLPLSHHKLLSFTVSCGSNGAMYALMALLYLDLFQNWQVLLHPIRNLITLSIIFLIVLAIGLLPYVDNYAHLGGFATGLISGLILVPTVTFGKWDGRRKKILMIVSVPVLIGLFFIGFWNFYRRPEVVCEWCGWLDCVPYGSAWCM